MPAACGAGIVAVVCVAVLAVEPYVWEVAALNVSQVYFGELLVVCGVDERRVCAQRGRPQAVERKRRFYVNHCVAHADSHVHLFFGHKFVETYLRGSQAFELLEALRAVRIEVHLCLLEVEA